MKNRNKRMMIALMISSLMLSSLVACNNADNTTDTSNTNNVDSISKEDSLQGNEDNENSISPDTQDNQETDNQKTAEEFTWEQKDLPTPTFNLEFKEVEGNKDTPIMKLQSFMDIDENNIKDKIKNNDFYKDFEFIEDTYEDAIPKSYTLDTLKDTTLKSDAIGYKITKYFDGTNKDNNTSVKYTFERKTGIVDGLDSFYVSINGDLNKGNADFVNAYEIMKEVLGEEIAEYVVYGKETEIEQVIGDKNIEIKMKREAYIDKDNNKYNCAFSIRIDTDEFTELELVLDSKSSSYETSAFNMIESHKLNSLFSEDIVGNLDITKDSDKFMGKLFEVYPYFERVYSTSLASVNHQHLEYFNSEKGIKDCYIIKIKPISQEDYDSGDTSQNSSILIRIVREDTVDGLELYTMSIDMNLQSAPCTAFVSEEYATNVKKQVVDSLWSVMSKIVPSVTFENVDMSAFMQSEPYRFEHSFKIDDIEIPARLYVSEFTEDLHVIYTAYWNKEDADHVQSMRNVADYDENC